MSVQVVKSKSNTSQAEQVLIENGFTVLSPWVDDNRFEKDGQVYKLSHPVWQIGPSGNFVGVRIEKED